MTFDIGNIEFIYYCNCNLIYLYISLILRVFAKICYTIRVWFKVMQQETDTSHEDLQVCQHAS
jgi:hypothetical protein